MEVLFERTNKTSLKDKKQKSQEDTKRQSYQGNFVLKIGLPY